MKTATATPDPIVLDGLVLLGILLAVAAVGIIIGAALGYYAAATDLRQERANAWERGFQDLRAAIEHAWFPPSTLLARVRNPYLERRLAPAPAVVRMPNPAAVADRSPAIFDQDEPTPAGRAVEIRGDQ